MLQNTKYKILLLLACLPLCGGAQPVQDVLLRQQLSVGYKLNSSWSVTGKYFLYLHDNASRFDQSVLGLEVNYKIFSWLEAGVEYRRSMNYKQDGHEFRYSLEGEYAPKKAKWHLKLRTLLEQSMDYLDADYLRARPATHVWRNRFIGAYKVSKKLDAYVVTELYLGRKSGTLLLEQANYGLGVDYDLKRRHSFNVEVQYRDYFNKKKPADVIRVDVGYKLSLGYQKPKKKKKKGHDGVEERIGE